MGRIGACFALMMMRGFKMNCLYFDNTGREDVEEKVAKYNKYLEDVGEPLENPLFCKRCENVEDLLKASDLVSLHVSMNQ